MPLTQAPVPQGAWTPYTPTVAVSSPGATPPTFGTITGRYQVTGKRVDFSLAVPIANNGTAGGNLQISLPLPTAVQVTAIGLNGGTADLLTGILSGSTATVIKTSGNGYPGSTGATVYLSGSYETP